jgi:hypothetical protein
MYMLLAAQLVFAIRFGSMTRIISSTSACNNAAIHMTRIFV